MQRRGFDLPELGDAADRAGNLNPARVHAALDAVDLVERIFAVFLLPETAGQRIEGHPEAVANAVGEDALDVAGRSRRRLQRPRSKNGLSVGRRAIVVQAEDHAGEMRVVRIRSAELIVGPDAGRARRQVLQRTAAAEIADHDVELAVRAKRQDAAIVIAARRLLGVALPGGIGAPSCWNASSVIRLRSKRRVLPFHTNRSTRLPSSGTSEMLSRVGQRACRVRTGQLLRQERIGIRRNGAAARPVEVDARIRRESRMQRDAEQPALGRELTLRSSATPRNAALAKCSTRPVLFSMTNASAPPRNAMFVGWVRPGRNSANTQIRMQHGRPGRLCMRETIAAAEG